MYHFRFTWTDGEVFEIDSDSQWEAQNHAHWERYGKYGIPEEFSLHSMEIDGEKVI